MAELTKSSVAAFKKEVTEGTLEYPSAGTDFVPLRSGFSFEGALETIDSDEIINSLGMTKSFVSKESPTISYPKYLRHSGVEGTEPEYGILIESAMGSKDIQATERNTVAGSTAGTAAARAVINVDTGEGVEYQTGKALLIKDGTNGYSIRNVRSVSSDALTLNFNLANAPGVGVDLGRAVQYIPTTSNHPTFSAFHYQASSTSAFLQAMAGCRTTAMNFEFPANGFAECSFEAGGIGVYFNPIDVGATDIYIDFSDTTPTTYAITVTQQSYKTPHELAREIETKMNAVGSVDTYTVTYSDTDGKYTIASDGTTFQLLWNTGANAANTIGDLLGYSVAADDTGALSYTSDNAVSFDPAYTPVYDSSDNIVIRSAELLVGSNDQITCRKATQASFSIGTPKADVSSICASTGVSESVVTSREATLSATLILEAYDAGLFDKFVNNTTTEIMLNAGPKSAGNWEAGKCVNIYMPNASITTHTIADNDSYVVINLEAKAFVSSSEEDVYVNFV